MRTVFCIFLLFLWRLPSTAGTVDTVKIYSSSMHKQVKAVVIKPHNYSKRTVRFPVLYLLHGYDGWYSNWIIRVPGLKEMADNYQMIIVCPDGAKSSWYFDSPVDSSYRYETHITKELIPFIDARYRTYADNKHRAITGLSMGGHGALFLGLRHPQLFGAAGSMSGVFDLKQSRNSYDIIKRIGDTVTNAKNWNDMSILGLIENHSSTPLQLIFDSGEADTFIEANRKLHQKLLKLKIPHTYIERPGSHSWDYWANSIPYQLLFFKNYFRQKS
jgi:S-formylglutathione hydrolase FrmB